MLSGKEKGLTTEYLSSFCDQIALMLESGMTVADGLALLAEKDGGFCAGLLETAETTGSLYEALKASGYDCPKYFVEMVGIGETTGRLETVMRNLAAWYRRESRLRSAAVSAVTYPAVLGAMMVVIILVLLIRVLPVFRRVLAGMGMGSTSVGWMNLGVTLGWIVLVTVGLLVVLTLLCMFLLKTAARDRVLTVLRRVLPPLRKLTGELSSARVAGILSLMLSSGFPVENALEMASNALTDNDTAVHLDQIRRQMTEEGRTFTEAVEESAIFSDLHTRIIRVGSASGHDAEAMERVATACEEAAEDHLSRLISLIEPALVALLSIVIGAVLLSVMLPVAGLLSNL